MWGSSRGAFQTLTGARGFCHDQRTSRHVPPDGRMDRCREAAAIGLQRRTHLGGAVARQPQRVVRYSLFCQAVASLKNLLPSKSWSCLSMPQMACSNLRITATTACIGLLPAATSLL